MLNFDLGATNMRETLITSSGIIRNRDTPRTGVQSGNSVKSWFFDLVDQGIDLAYEEMRQDMEKVEKELDALEASEDYDGKAEDMDVLQAKLEEFNRALEYSEGGDTILVGDWTKDANGLYVPDKNGPEGFAATYSRDTNEIFVEWSKTVRRTHHTSPCFVMSDGSGPCGDLDTEGDSVLAYALPADLVGNDY